MGGLLTAGQLDATLKADGAAGRWQIFRSVPIIETADFDPFANGPELLALGFRCRLVHFEEANPDSTAWNRRRNREALSSGMLSDLRKRSSGS